MTPQQMIHYDIEGVILDIKEGQADKVCIETLRRVQDFIFNPWQPIEAAPEDKELLLIRVKDGRVACCPWVAKIPNHLFPNPTHWMPLPEPLMEKKNEKDTNPWAGKSTEEIVPDAGLGVSENQSCFSHVEKRIYIFSGLTDCLKGAHIYNYRRMLIEKFDLAFLDASWRLTKKGKAYLYAALREKIGGEEE